MCNREAKTETEEGLNYAFLSFDGNELMTVTSRRNADFPKPAYHNPTPNPSVLVQLTVRD